MRCLLIPALVIAVPVLAQTQPDSAKRLPVVTTTATRNATSTLTTPMAVTKVTLEELRTTNGFGIEDALRGIPGVIAQSRYGTSDVRLIIRGYGARGAGDRSNSGTSRGVRVLLDGFPETEPDGRTAFDQVDLQTATSVETVRSNASSLWGNAAGGVISISSMPVVDVATQEAQLTMGEFGLKRASARMATPLGASGAAWMNFTNTSFEGWRKHSDARRSLVNAGVIGNLTDKTRLGVFLVAANNLMRIPGPLTQAEMDADRAQANPTYNTRDERRYNRLGRLGASVEHQLGSSASISSMFYINPKYLQRSERNTYRDFTRYHVGGNLVGRKSMDIGSMKHRFTAGVDEAYQDGSIQFYVLTANSRGTLSDNKGEGAQNLGIFVQDELAISDDLSLLIGARQDRVSYNYRSFLPASPIKAQSRDFTRISPKLGVNYRLTSTMSVYANMGGGLEAPAGNETDPQANPPSGGALLNPLLDAISSTTMEAGVKSAGMSLMGGTLTVGWDAAIYTIDVSNEIIPYNGGRFYQTAAAATRRGLELGVNAMAPMGVFAKVALTFNDHTYEKYLYDSTLVNVTTTGKADLSGNQVMGVPKLAVDAEVGLEVPFYRNLRLSGTVQHSGEYFADDRNSVTIPSSTVFGLKAGLREPLLTVGGVSLRGFVLVHNLTDVEYVGSAFLNPDPGAGGQLSVFEPGMPRAVTFSFTLART